MKDDEKNEVIMNYERAKVFSNKQLKVHITKKNGIFYNGIIIEVSKSKDFFFIDDLIEGKKLVFFSELSKEIEEYTRL